MINGLFGVCVCVCVCNQALHDLPILQKKHRISYCWMATTATRP